MTHPHGAGSDVAEHDEREFTVAIPGPVPERTEVVTAAAPVDTQVLASGVPEETQRLPVDERTPRYIPPMPKPDPDELPSAPVRRAPPADSPAAAAPASRTNRFGAALFWMAMGWWLLAAVRAGAELVEASVVDGSIRRLPSAALLDIMRDATDRGRVELIAAAALSLVAAAVLVTSRGRRLLGVAAVLVAVGTAALAWWHLAP